MRKTIKNFMYIKRKETAIMMIAVAIAIIAGMVLGFFVSMGDDETVQRTPMWMRANSSGMPHTGSMRSDREI